MRYTRSIVSGLFILCCVITYSVFVYFWNKGKCPVGTFSCDDNQLCVPQRNVCDERYDCPNNEDEDPTLCIDMNGSVNMVYKTYNKSGEIFPEDGEELVCDLTNFPSVCMCKYRVRLICKNHGLKVVPQDISQEVSHLILTNNSIVLHEDSFSKYEGLVLIHLEGNHISHIPQNTFHQQKHLQKLHMSNNELKFDGCLFPSLPNLLELFLRNNLIAFISRYTFSDLVNLELLDLGENKISRIDALAFHELNNLKELNLHGNSLKTLNADLFVTQIQLNKLYMGKNPFHNLPSHIFNNLQLLASLNLDEIEIENIDIEIFSKLKNLKFIYFKKYHYCSYAPSVLHCHPVSNGISSTHQLLEKPVLRYATWATGIITCVGNILVICGRLLSKSENTMLNTVIQNLAASDILMGLYLVIIGFHDVKFRDVYNQEAHAWMSSWVCIMAGITAMASSEVSVLLIVFMSIERFLIIASQYPNYCPASKKRTFTILLSIWGFGIGSAVIPAMGLQTGTRFYGQNGLCFPLHIEDPFFLGWKYSAVIMLGINFLSLLMVMTLYIIMFINIWKTRRATSLPMKDYELAVRFFFIMLTDAVCWFPIIIVKMIALFDTDISKDMYAWLVVFILPVNSAINPILYTLTTTKYRATVFKLCVPAQPAPAQPPIEIVVEERWQVELLE